MAGKEGEFKRTTGGQVVISRLQPGVLEKLAEATGGLDQTEREQKFVQLLAKVEK